MITVSIDGLDGAEVFAELYNSSKVMGMGFLHYTPERMTAEEMHLILSEMRKNKQAIYFDYLKGRIMKTGLVEDNGPPTKKAIYCDLYDRDNGPGAAALVVERLRASRSSS